MNAYTSSRRGFTLVELIISVALFTAVMTIAASAYLSMISLSRRARAVNDVVSNLSFAVESMSRSIRTGSNYSCAGGTNCWPGGGPSFYFLNDQGQSIGYFLNSDNRIAECINQGSCNTSTGIPLTDPRITITNLTFYVQGVGTSGSDAIFQPRVLFTISGSVIPDAGSAPITFTIQSGATQRFLDL